MKATGMVRRIDDLGRIVMPKEIRSLLRIREGDPLEIYVGSYGEVIFKKHSQIASLTAFSRQYAEALSGSGGHPVLVCDRDSVVAAAGVSSKEFGGQRVSAKLEVLMQQRKSYVRSEGEAAAFSPIEGADCTPLCCFPIIASGDVCGCIMFLADDKAQTAGEIEVKLIATAASFLGKQLEV